MVALGLVGSSGGALGLGSHWVKSCYAPHELGDVGEQPDISEPLSC